MKTSVKMEKMEEKKPIIENFIKTDILEYYLYYCGYNSIRINSWERYNILVKCITFGMELLPHYTEDKDKKKRDLVDALYTDAKEVLKTEVPNETVIEYNPGGKATDDEDLNTLKVTEAKLPRMMYRLKMHKYVQHIPNLQIIHNRIFYKLVQTGIIPSEQFNIKMEKMEGKNSFDWNIFMYGREKAIEMIGE